MKPDPVIAGLLLAGGRSSRFGSEKAVFDLGSGLMMDAPLSALGAVCAVTAVSARFGSGAEAQAKLRGLPCLHDLPGDPEGPLAGLRVGLQWALSLNAAWLITAPCDGPGLRAENLQALVTAVDRGAPAAVAASARGFEPLVAIWPVSNARDLIGRELDTGSHPPVRAILERLGAVSVAGFDGLNVNTPDDLRLR